MNTQTGFSIVNDTRTLKALNSANKIKWPVDVNNTTKKPFKYVDEVESEGMNFTHKGNKYQLRYHSGCFYPYLYIIF